MWLAGKKALITGSSSGIGLGAAQAFVRAGAAVVVTSERPLSDLPEIASLTDGGNAHYVQADMTKEGEPARLVDKAWEKLGGFSILVNNVGTFREPGFLDLSWKNFEFVFRLNVWSSVAATQQFVKRARQAGQGGRILFTTSLNGTRSEPAHTLYDASKGAINALTRQLAVELAPDFTTVAIAPGLVETPLTDMGLRSDPAARQAILDQIPVRRIASVDDLAQWYVFLASDAAGYATGNIITVDGGLDAQQMPSRPLSGGEQEIARPA
ncbi:SDR family NAD(P)-dependent oxidoreductase [Zavarzinella formosa]|uniref:SDR family NAD(P)-dependent oxidoreductase n=1 Tax=Zavarzinella formosa TaxID=360055 RepID=UPI00030B7EEF|nr:SDR family oxidoreductase [Zavarzinella formosa]